MKNEKKIYLIKYDTELPDVIEAESLKDAENEILNKITIFEEVKMKKFTNIVRCIKSLIGKE
jgi:hypothetical protein